ncbi:MerR family transcriptional regulator [Paenibacillus glycanilyticus]|uniref:MerR family transcriptional regulator n=1 Tax=Paenibacillus glycanilyticus TaxID=126569 RepID=A0ABQ6GHT9_9BACL|nr:cobalamin-dependent protein [Paenibacillus glycanilyticus]GLX69845.1 MerR family transcriptional regulator [Paenibacillus glycanilyticus]
MYSIRKVSQLVGIPAVTIRAWENRYQLTEPIRSTGGHRLYRDADIDALRWIKQQMDGHHLKISEAVTLYRDKMANSAVGTIECRFASLIDRLYRELADLNTVQANEVIDLCFSLFHHEEVFHHILTPVMKQIGAAWEHGLLSVAQEHFASQIIIQRCTQFMRILPLNPQLPRAVALCPQGEHHQMGLMLFSLFLRNKGHDVIYLGPDTPLDDITDLIRAKNIEIAAISANNPKLANSVEQWIAENRQSYPELAIIIGGDGFRNCSPTLAPHVYPPGPSEWDNWYRLLLRKSGSSYVQP